MNNRSLRHASAATAPTVRAGRLRFRGIFIAALAAVAFASLALDFAYIGVKSDPPEVVSVSGGLGGCVRTDGGLLIDLGACRDDVWLSFEGLPDGVEVDYSLLSVDGEAMLSGTGAYLPVSACPDAVAAHVSSRTAGADLSSVSSVDGAFGEKAMAHLFASRIGAAASRTRRFAREASNPPDLVIADEDGFRFYYAEPVTMTLTPGSLTNGDSVAGLSISNQTREISSVDEMLVSGNFPGHGAFELSASGNIHVVSGETFRVGADDYADAQIGSASSHVNGRTGFRWGNFATNEVAEGVFGASFSFGSYGGPYEFDIEGISDRTFYGASEPVGFAGLQADPAEIVIPWQGSDETSSLTVCDADERVSYSVLMTDGFGSLSGGGLEWTFTPAVADFLSSRLSSDDARFTLAQSVGGASVSNGEAVVTLRRQEPAAAVTPSALTVTPDTNGVVYLEGMYTPYLVYRFDGEEGPVKEFPMVDPPVDAGSVWTNVVSLAWIASYNGDDVGFGTNDVVVVYNRSRKDAVADECACAAGGSTAGDGCVSFTQRFGTTPGVSSAPWGVLAIEEEYPTAHLATPAVLRYNHPAMRRLAGGAVGSAVVFPPLGHPITYQNGRPSQHAVMNDSRLVSGSCNGIPAVREVFSDRSEVVYTNGVPAAIVTPDGVTVDVADLGIEVVCGQDGAIRQIWSATDGLLVVAAYGGRFRVNWYAPAAVGPKNAAGEYTHAGSPLKYFDFGTPPGGTTGQSFSLVEHRSAELEFPVRWDWDAAAQDWTMVRGSGADAVTRTRAVTDNADGTWTVTESAFSAHGTAREESKTYSAANGNAPVSATSGGRQTYSAVRADSGGGAGRPCNAIDSLGLSTTNVYDSAGRTVYTATSGGAVDRETYYEYPSGGATPDFTPSRTVRVAGGITNRIDTYERIGTREDGLTEMSTVSDGSSVRTNLTVRFPSLSANVFEAGRVALTVAPDGAATSHSYEAAEGFLYIHTATRGIALDGNFATVEGKSTRTRDFYDAQGNVAVTVSEALAGGEWRETASATNTYNVIHKRLGTVRSNGRFSDSSQICTGPLWTLGEDGIATTNRFDSTKRMVSSTRHGPFGAVATAYTLDAEGRVIGETRTADGVEPQTVARTYDTEGRLTSETDEQGLTTTYAYSADGRTTTTTIPSGGTRVTTLNADGTTASVTGTAVTPEYYSYGVTANGLEWTKVTYLSPDGARWTKTYRNAFGETVREERPGANGSTIVTEHTYNEKGQLVTTATTGQPAETRAYDAWGDVVSVTRTADGVTRTVATATENALVDGEVWQVSSRTASCSDSSIAPLVTTNMTQVSGLSLANESRQVSIDVRGNASETWSEFDPATSTRLTYTSIPTATNVALSETVDGVTTLSVSHSAVTNTVAYDAYRRAVVQTDGRGNATTNAYDALGRLASTTDPTGAATSYAYDAAGRLAAVTNALGVATVYEYDLRGNRTYEGGGTYPVSYSYDAFNVMTNMTTYRAEGTQSGDTTTWAYDEATGLLLSKTYADGHGPTYTYTDSGNLATRTWARGVVTTYAYDGWNQLLSCDYSDSTPSVIFVYDAMGRQQAVADAAGVTSFSYDAFGDPSGESVSGIYSKTMTRHRDAFGRDLGYTLDNSRKNIIEYESDTARIKRVMMAGAWFTYYYLPGTDLKSRLQYGGSGSAYYTYEPHRDLLTQVQNYINGGVISQYDYVNDAAGRRTAITRSGSMMSETRTDYYDYNDRNELTNAVKNVSLNEYAYQYDDIGNRTAALDLGTNHTYTANSLNQYTQISNLCDSASLREEFFPQFDDDGNQTLIKTATGIWQVSYNAENRPVLWECGATNIVMKFDRMGRRVEYVETVSGVTNTHHRFVYDGYLCIQRLNAASNNSIDLVFGWDPSEQVATRPLILQKYGAYSLFYTHDGNKNVSELVFFQQANGIAAHYEYAPFGAVTATSRNTSVTVYDFREYNPFSFSSEYADGVLRLVYYNYRHYNPVHGRWTGRDVVAEYGGINVYAFCGNSINTHDFLGLDGSKCRCCCAENVSIQIQKNIDGYIQSGKNQMSRFMGHSINVQIVMNEIENDQSTNSCSLVWLERSNINMTIDGRTVPKNQWNHLPSDTWQANQWREKPSFDANGNATKVIRDDPQIEIGRFILHGETIISDKLRTETRILEFDISVISGEGCPCSKDKAQVRATQKLVSINGVPKWEQSSFVIH